MIALKYFRSRILHLNYIYVRQSQRNYTSNETREKWKSVIGLEIHAQLATRSKLFSSGSTEYGLSANSCVNLFDAAIPGTLPVLNKRAVEMAVATALALKCEINPLSMFDRKHYFYFDLPNGYQITQQRKPIAQNGKLEYAVFNPCKHKSPYYKTCKIKQIQLEQDSGKTVHDINSMEYYIDLNRAGTSLIEIVCEPDVNDAEEAAALLNELCLILKRVGSCTCKMEEGTFRVDANVSIHQEGQELGVRTEVKNINSFRGVVHAIDFEIKRQLKIIKSGGKVINETLTWDSQKKKTILLRDKEEKHDYRFMPEPNLIPLRIIIDENSKNIHSAVKNRDCILDLRHLRNEIPLLPQEERMILMKKHNTSHLVAYNLVSMPELYKYFRDIITDDPSRNVHDVYSVLMICLLTALGDLAIDLKKCQLHPKILGEVVDLKRNTITNKVGTLILKEILLGSELSPTDLVKEKNLTRLSKEEIRNLCIKWKEKNPNSFERHSKNKKKFLVKQIVGMADYRTTTLESSSPWKVCGSIVNCTFYPIILRLIDTSKSLIRIGGFVWKYITR